eukprot:TRINITY_DN891_c0_g1_i1.p1 TRINITY_DN891_c0_g1~~TRINITY_DN891_c0_g1_i1.p1  ORF type:complete len:242 (-),score=37.02 TRINITY_DN891_c0_g1_i1:56-727(-)
MSSESEQVQLDVQQTMPQVQPQQVVYQQVGQRYQFPNKGKVFAVWDDTFPAILQSKLTFDEYSEFIKTLNAVRLMGKNATLGVVCFYAVWYCLYPVVLWAATSKLGEETFAIAWLAFVASLPVGIISLSVLAILRYKKMRARLAELLIFYNEHLFAPKGLRLCWEPTAFPILVVEEIVPVVAYLPPQPYGQPAYNQPAMYGYSAQVPLPNYSSDATPVVALDY